MKRRPAKAPKPVPPEAKRPAPVPRRSIVPKAARLPAQRSPRAANPTSSAGSQPVLPPAAPSSGAFNHLEEQFSIPTRYGVDRLVLMVKDPWWLYAYWEVQPDTERAARGQLLPHEIAGLKSVLRVYDVTEQADPAHAPAMEISLSGLATNWYIPTNGPGRSFCAELGLLANTGRFLRLAGSHRVTAPRFGPSETVDPAWAMTEDAYWKLFGASAAIGLGSSPAGWTSGPQPLSSTAMPSSAGTSPGGRSAVRGFWCRVDTDLVIHGATEPKASVLVQGQPVAVRKDGSFSLRVALPSGTQTITIEVTSPDGREMKTVTPLVTLAWAGSLAPETGKPMMPVRRSRPRGKGGA